MTATHRRAGPRELTADARAVRARDGRARPVPDLGARRRRRDRAATASIEGFVGGQCAESSVRTAALDALATASRCCCGCCPRTTVAFPESHGAQVVVNPCLSGGALEIFLEPMLPAPLVDVVGDTPVADALVDDRRRARLRSRRAPAATSRTARPRWSWPATAATSWRRSAPRSTPASATSRWSPAASAGAAVLDELGLTRRRARPDQHPGRARHRRPHRARGRAVDPGRGRHRGAVAAAAARRTVAADARSQAIDPVCGMTVTVLPDTPHLVGRRPGLLVLQPAAAATRYARGRRAAGHGRERPVRRRRRRPRAAWTRSTTSSTRAWRPRVFLALTLGQPLLLEGEPGVGKTAAAKALAPALDTPLIRLQCYEGLTVGEALYEWNYQRQLLAIRLAESRHETLRRRRPVHRGVPAGTADPAGDPARRPDRRRCCSSTRSTAPTTSSRRCCSSSSARPRSPSPSSARSPPTRPPGRGPDLQPQPRAARRAAPPLPLPLDRLPGAGRARPRSCAARVPAANEPLIALDHRVRRAGPRRSISTRRPGMAETIDWVSALAALGRVRAGARRRRAHAQRDRQDPRRPRHDHRSLDRLGLALGLSPREDTHEDRQRVHRRRADRRAPGRC